MGKKSKRKGNRAEREVVRLLKDLGINAKRVPISGAAEGFKGDVVIDDRITAEVKIRASGLKTVYSWFTQPVLFMRTNKRPWLVVMDVNTFVKLWKNGGEAFGIERSPSGHSKTQEE